MLISRRRPNFCLEGLLELRGNVSLSMGDNPMEVVLWGFVDDLNVIPIPRVLSKCLFLFLCIYLLTVIIFICICSFNLVIGRFCEQNRKSKIEIEFETIYVLIICL